MNPTYHAIIFSFNENLNTVSKTQFLWIDREWWALIIQFIVGAVTAFAVIYASRKALKWSEQNLKQAESRSLKYFSGVLKMLRAGMGLYVAIDSGMADNISTNPEKLLSELKMIFSEIYDQKSSISNLLPRGVEVKYFIDSLLIIKNLLDNEKGSPEENYPAWELGDTRLTEIIDLIDRSFSN